MLAQRRQAGNHLFPSAGVHPHSPSLPPVPTPDARYRLAIQPEVINSTSPHQRHSAFVRLDSDRRAAPARPATAATCHTDGRDSLPRREAVSGRAEYRQRPRRLADAMRSRDPQRFAEFLDPDLVWEGLEPGLRCDGRQQAMSIIRNRFAAAPLIVQAVEAIEAGQHVTVGLRGPGFNGTLGDLHTVGQIYNVFTLSEGKVVRWRDFLTRQEALAAADAQDQPWQ